MNRTVDIEAYVTALVDAAPKIPESARAVLRQALTPPPAQQGRRKTA